MSPYVPEQGDLIWLSLSPQHGHERAGRRPALVVSPAAYNSRVGLALGCPITNQRKGYPFEVALPEGLEVTGVILADQWKSLDWQVRRAAWIGGAPEAVTQEVLCKLEPLLRPS